jgi:hypothetical protein
VGCEFEDGAVAETGTAGTRDVQRRRRVAWRVVRDGCEAIREAMLSRVMGEPIGQGPQTLNLERVQAGRTFDVGTGAPGPSIPTCLEPTGPMVSRGDVIWFGTRIGVASVGIPGLR